MNTFFVKQLKKILICMLIMIVSCCIFVINVGAEESVIVVEKQLFGASDVLTTAKARSADLDALKDYLRKELKKFPEYIDVAAFNIPYTNENVQIVTDFIWHECPELFFVDSFGIYMLDSVFTRVYVDYEYSVQECAVMYADCMEQVDKLVYGVMGNDKLTDVQKALILHDRLAAHCEYDIENYYNGSIPAESYTMYGALVNRFAVCQGYAEAYYYLLEKVGIENRLCPSYDLNHVWNIVTVNGKEYHVDVTWDDPTPDISGSVWHDNFLRSSDGIITTGHGTNDYDKSPSDTTYDSYFWQELTTEFQVIDNEIYYLDNDAAAIKKYSDKSIITDCSDKWIAASNGAYYTGNFSKLGSDGKDLYYNLSEAVYKYTISTGKTEKIWSPDLSAGELFRIYGFTYQDGYLICDLNDSPAFSRTDKKTYQQRYLYQDLTSGTPESMSINMLPLKTEYYIGDELNTTGLQLKLTYSNGLTDFISSGFTVSGFNSSSSGTKEVTVSYKGFSETFNVTVKTPSIVLDARNIGIEINNYCRLAATTDPNNVTVKWSTSDNNVATVSDGEIAAVSVGSATVTAEFTYNGYTYKTSCDVTVECKHRSVQTLYGTYETCTSSGLTDGKKCYICGLVIVEQQIIPARGHDPATREKYRMEPTCGEDGSYHLVTYCSWCLTILDTEVKTLPATGDHVYATETKRVASTCKTAGYVVTACGCGETKTTTLSLDPNNHENIVVVDAVSATCTQSGLTEGEKCSACGTVTVAQQTIKAKGHTEVAVNGKEATCTQTGLTDGKKCSDCGTVTVAQQTIAAKGHTQATREENRKEASCSNAGSYNLVTYCTVCNEVLKTETKTIPATGDHVYATETKRVASTCKTAGYVVTACGCGETKTTTLSLDPNNHENIVVVDAVSATCTQSGLTEGEKCSACGTVTVAQQTIKAKGHTQATREENRKEASCSNAGSYNLVTYCTVCDEVLKTETKTIPATGDHVYATETKRVASTCKTAGYVEMSCGCGETKTTTLSLDPNNHENIVVVDAVSATCTQSGLTEGKQCSACGTVTVAQQEIAKTAHKEVAVKGKSATCTETGLTDGKKCSVCGAVTVAQKEIAKTAHKEVTVKGKTATCTETGLTDGKKCSVCGTVTVGQTEIEKTAHRTVMIPGKSPTETETGLTDGEKCVVCGTVTKEQQIIPVLNHTHAYTATVIDPTCTEMGYTTYSCSCGDTYVGEYSDATGHKIEIIAGYESTCTETGLTDGEKCTVCGEVISEQKVIQATGHKEEIIHCKEATCTETGLTEGAKCSVCGEILKSQEVVAAKSHNYGDWFVEKPATTESEGLKVRICTHCGDRQTEVVPQLPEIPDDPSEPEKMLADANGDNKITAADARLILRMAAKLEPSSDEEIAYLDINGDKKITAADARIVLRVSAKIDSIENYKKQ